MHASHNRRSNFAKNINKRGNEHPCSNLTEIKHHRPRDSGKDIGGRTKLAIGAVAFATLIAGNIELREAGISTAPHRAVSHVAVQLVAEITEGAGVIGVADSNLYHLSQSQLTARLTELQSLGVTDLRIAVPWVYIEPTTGAYDWTQMDNLVQTASSMGFSITGNITGTPMWAGALIAGAPNPAAYATFAGTVAARYGSQISTYEIWNEPNGVVFYAPISAASYTELLQGAYTAIKAVQPTATVLAGALGATKTFSGITLSPTEFLKQMYAAGAAGYFDALSYHPYHYSLPFSLGGGIANSPLEQVNELYAIMAANGDGDLQIWATEYGNATTPGLGVTQSEQADMMRDFLTGWSRLAFAGPAFVFSGRDFSTGVINQELNFGLFTSNGTPKEAAQVLAELIDLSAQGALPDYTASEMSYARQIYLQVASVAFGVLNQALILPHAVMTAVYNTLPVRIKKAFDAVVAVVCGVMARAMTRFAVRTQRVIAAAIAATPGMTEALDATKAAARQSASAGATVEQVADPEPADADVVETSSLAADPELVEVDTVVVDEVVTPAMDMEPAEELNTEEVSGAGLPIEDVQAADVETTDGVTDDVETNDVDTTDAQAAAEDESESEAADEANTPRTALTAPRSVKTAKKARSVASVRSAAA